MTKEKKQTIIITVATAIVAILLIVAFALVNLQESGTVPNEETNETVKEFNKYFNSKDKKIIYYASSSCGYCTLQAPILETIAEDYDLDYLYIDSAALGAKQRQDILDKLNIKHATPTTVVVEDGGVVDTLVGYTAGNEFVEFLIEADVLDEDAEYSGEKYITYVNYEEYEEIIEESGTNIIVIGQTTCSHCIAIKPALNTVAKDYDLTINYLNITDLTKDEYNSFKKSLEEIKYNDEKFVSSGSFGTPLTLIVENGKVTKYISGQRTASQLAREFKKAGLISE